VLVDFEIKKKQDCLQVFFSYYETKFFGVYFNHVSCMSIFILIFGPKFSIWVLKAYFCSFDPQKYIISWSMLNSRSMDISHDHTDFGPQIPFLGSGGLFSPFWPLKVYIFFIFIKFSIDWWPMSHDMTYFSHDLFHFAEQLLITFKKFATNILCFFKSTPISMPNLKA
jgi:uncharacterized protein YggT (Ycf19 family)